jgi:hypothetical protein
MLLFRSEEHAQRWSQDRGLPPGGTMSLQTGWALGREWYANKPSPDWRRKTLDEVEACFAELGLTGDFWSFRP